MLVYSYQCPGCDRQCATDASYVRPRVHCRCGCVFRVPKKAKLVLGPICHVDLRRIVRTCCRN